MDNYTQEVLKSTISNLFSPFYGARKLLNKSWFSYILETTKNHHFPPILEFSYQYARAREKSTIFHEFPDTIRRGAFYTAYQLNNSKETTLINRVITGISGLKSILGNSMNNSEKAVKSAIIVVLTHTFTEPKVFYIFTVLRGAVLPVKLPLASVLGQLGPSLSGFRTLT